MQENYIISILLKGTGFFIETLIGVFAIVSINSILMPIDKWLSTRKEWTDTNTQYDISFKLK